MSERFVLILALVAAFAAVVYVFRDRIPSPRVSADRPFVAINDHRVIPSADGSATFEVLSRPGAAGPQYFCAAAEYAKKVLRAEPKDMLVTLTPETESASTPGFRSVTFEVQPAGGAAGDAGGVTLDLSRAGVARSVAVAWQLCR